MVNEWLGHISGRFVLAVAPGVLVVMETITRTQLCMHGGGCEGQYDFLGPALVSIGFGLILNGAIHRPLTGHMPAGNRRVHKRAEEVKKAGKARIKLTFPDVAFSNVCILLLLAGAVAWLGAFAAAHQTPEVRWWRGYPLAIELGVLTWVVGYLVTEVIEFRRAIQLRRE